MVWGRQACWTGDQWLQAWPVYRVPAELLQTSDHLVCHKAGRHNYAHAVQGSAGAAEHLAHAEGAQSLPEVEAGSCGHSAARAGHAGTLSLCPVAAAPCGSHCSAGRLQGAPCPPGLPAAA